MDSEKIIELIDNEFDSNPQFRIVNSIQEVESVFRHFEQFCGENDLALEFEVPTEEFDELQYDEEDDQEICFEVPINGTDLVFEFTYFRLSENEYHIWVDADFYIEDEEDVTDYE